MTDQPKTAIHSESISTWSARFRELVAAARKDGYTLSLEDADTDHPYVDLEKRTKEGSLADWDTIIWTEDLT